MQVDHRREGDWPFTRKGRRRRRVDTGHWGSESGSTAWQKSGGVGPAVTVGRRRYPWREKDQGHASGHWRCEWSVCVVDGDVAIGGGGVGVGEAAAIKSSAAKQGQVI